MSKCNLKNKILSMLLVMALVVTMIPMNVFASEETYTEGLTFQKTTNGSTGEVYYQSEMVGAFFMPGEIWVFFNDTY